VVGSGRREKGAAQRGFLFWKKKEEGKDETRDTENREDNKVKGEKKGLLFVSLGAASPCWWTMKRERGEKKKKLSASTSDKGIRWKPTNGV